MTTEQAINKFADLSPALANFIVKIKEQEAFKNYIKDGLNKKARTDNMMFALNVLIPTAIKTCNAEFYEILSVCADKRVEELKAQPFRETVKQVRALVDDEDFMYFFTLFLKRQTTKEDKAAEPSQGELFALSDTQTHE